VELLYKRIFEALTTFDRLEPPQRKRERDRERDEGLFMEFLEVFKAPSGNLFSYFHF